MMSTINIPEKASLILAKDTIERKMLRMAYEIFERNPNEQEIILAGVTGRGLRVAQTLKEKVQAIAPFTIHLLEIILDKEHPQNAFLQEGADCNGKIVIVVDDVTHSGRTLFYGLRPFMDMLPKEIETAVLVDRMHKNFPVLVDYTGYRLSTTLQESVLVDITEEGINGVYLD